jgi:16S rRNA (cytidine1402-2'-O)-methyltransferase
MTDKTAKDVQGAAKAHQGVLYLVGTPIGNLEDITLRALRILKEVDVIACEDTRQTQKLLNHFGIEKRTTSYQEHNEAAKAAELALRMERGERVALVSDAGMPGISDPGYRVVQASIQRNIRVVPIPGPSALAASLVASGLPTDAFCFLGFLPAKQAQRRRKLKEMESLAATLVFFEAPHRILETLADVIDVLGDRSIAIAREVTKVHEEFLRGRCSQLLEELRGRSGVRGEMTLVVAGGGARPAAAALAAPLRERVGELMKTQSLSRMEALKAVAHERGISKSQAYREYQSGD